MPALREIFAQFDVDFDRRKELERGDKQVDKVTEDLGRLDRRAKKTSDSLRKLGQIFGTALGAMGVGIAVGWLRRFVDETTQAADAIDKLSQQLGFTVQQLQEYQLAAELGGVNSRAFSRSIRQLQQRALQAAEDGGSMADQFRRLGVEVRTSSGRLKSGSELFGEVGRALVSIENPTERVARAQLLMGESGARLLPMMRDVAGGGSRLRRQLEELGGGFSEIAVRRSVEIRDALTRLKVAFDSVRGEIIERYGPAILDGIEILSRFVVVLGRVVEKSHILRASLVTLTGIMGALLVATIGTWGPIVLLIAVVVGLAAAIDDLWVTFEGGDSVLRRILDHFLGFQRAQQVIDNARQAVDDLVGALRAADRYIGHFLVQVDRTIGLLTGSVGAADPEQARRNLQEIRRAAVQQAEARRRATEGELFLRQAMPEFEQPVDPYVRQVITRWNQQQTVLPDVRVDAPVNIQISGVTDPEEVGRVVDQRLREHSDRQARQLQAALVPGGAS